MSSSTKIEWTRSDDGTAGATWNPVSGCTEVSSGCDRCYAKTFAERWRGTPGHYFEHGFDVSLRPDKLDLPLRWSRPRRIFVNSMSDLFHDQVPDAYIAQVFAVMALAPQHTFQVLTKRHGRMRATLRSAYFCDAVRKVWEDRSAAWPLPRDWVRPMWPLPNVWLGVSAENQQWADIRIPALLDTPAAIRFVSAEPLLGQIDLGAALKQWAPKGNDPCRDGNKLPDNTALHWVISGGESGRNARPAHPDWFRLLRDQCQAAGIAYFHKQHGEYQPLGRPDDDGATLYVERETCCTATDDEMRNIGTGHWWGVRRVGKKAAGRELDGRIWDEFPKAVDGVEAMKRW